MKIEELNKGVKYYYGDNDDELSEIVSDVYKTKHGDVVWLEKNSNGEYCNSGSEHIIFNSYTIYTGKHFEDLTEIDVPFKELNVDTQHRLKEKRKEGALIEGLVNLKKWAIIGVKSSHWSEAIYRLKKEEPKELEPLVVTSRMDSLERRIGMLEKLQGMTEPNFGNETEFVTKEKEKTRAINKRLGDIENKMGKASKTDVQLIYNKMALLSERIDKLATIEAVIGKIAGTTELNFGGKG